MNQRYSLNLPKWGKIALILVLTLGVLRGFYSLIQEKNRAVNMMESVYEKSFYDLVMDVNDMEIKLEKLSVSSGVKYQRELLLDVSERATLANGNLAQISLDTGVLQGTTKYVNQVGDFAKSLYEKLNEGGEIDEKDRKSLKKLHEISVEVGKRLSAVRDEIGEGKSFINNFDDISTSFSEIDDISVDYPELIYDGPFSDSVVNKAPKGLNCAKITPEDGEKIAKQIGDYLGVSISYAGSWEGKITTLNYENDSSDVLIKLAECGQLLSFSAPAPIVKESIINEEDAVRIGYEFLYSMGFEGLTPVWYSNYNGNVFVNYVHEDEGVLVYNDMIKIKVSGESGKVVGFEGMAYAYNHVSRDIGEAVVVEDEVMEKISGEISVETIRLALVPKGEKEILSYEVFGTRGEKKYFIYIDAVTGEEINILCVIDSDQGDLLM